MLCALPPGRVAPAAGGRAGRVILPAMGFTEGQVLTVFRSRLRGEALVEYAGMLAEMLATARAMPGFVDVKTFTAEDGERATVVTFADAASQAGWRTHARHRVAQRAGRDRFYAAYSLQVATVTAVSGFDPA